MEISSTGANHPEIARLVNSVVVPRPIAWVTSRGATGVNNLSPFSFFQIVSIEPVIVMISFSDERDSYLNILETKEFVVNSVTVENVETAVLSSADVDGNTDEAHLLGLNLTDSVVVAVPRLASTRTALECRLLSVTRVGSGRVVFAEVVHVYVADSLLDEHRRIDVTEFGPVGRMGSNFYAVSDSPRSIDRPTPEELLSWVVGTKSSDAS
jgi:flavin reductase (DIM6/NTAB) family NADH-FMN oxidoreductase RutF